jgi:hypothetical protein
MVGVFFGWRVSKAIFVSWVKNRWGSTCAMIRWEVGARKLLERIAALASGEQQLPIREERSSKGWCFLGRSAKRRVTLLKKSSISPLLFHDESLL